MGVDAAETKDAHDGFVVRIELDGTDDSRTLNLEEPFRVALKNNGNRAIRVLNPDTQEGYYQFSFHFRNLRSGETHVVAERRIDDKGFWELRDDSIDVESATLEIAAKGSLTSQFELSRWGWDGGEWEGLPRPNSADRFALSVQFESTVPANGSRDPVWTVKSQQPPSPRGLSMRD